MRKQRRPTSTRPPSPKKVFLVNAAVNIGASTNAVSHVVRGDPGVADATRARISALLDEMEYRPNYAARILVSKKTGVLHVLLVAPMFHGHGRVLLPVPNAGSETGYHVSLSNAYRPDGTLYTQVAPFDVDGAVILTGQDPSVELAIEIGKRIPTCLLLSSEKNPEGTPTTSIDDVRGPRLAAEHLLRQGVSDIVYIAGPRNWSDAMTRRQGFTQACEEMGVEGQVIESFSWNAYDDYDAMRSLSHLSRALRCMNGQLVLGAMHLIHERGAKVLEGVRVVGFDDVDGAGCYMPSLTTIRQPFDRLGHTGVRLVYSLMEGGRIEDVIIDPEFVIQTSSTL